MSKAIDRSQNDIRIVFSGSWQAHDVVISEKESSRVEDQKMKADLKTSWEATKTDAESKGQMIWDGLVYRFEDHSISNGQIEIQISTIPFSIRFEMNKFTEQIKELGLPYAPKGMYTSCLIRTKDDNYVFIEKSSKYVTNKKYAWVGGVLSKSEALIECGDDLFQATIKEVTEELGIDKSDIVYNKLKIGYLTENWNFCLLFSLKINLTKQEVEHKFNVCNDGEALRLIYLVADDINSELYIFDSKDQKKFVLLNLI